MISVIHPGSAHLGVGGSRVPQFGPQMTHSSMGAYPTGQSAVVSYGHQLMMAAKAGEQISDLYRRRDSGYTHHVSTPTYQPQPQINPRGSMGQPSTTLSGSQSSANRSLSRYLNSPSLSKKNESVITQKKPRGLVMGQNGAKDYSKPLFVDCSIEYELPNAPKIPKNSLPILMIHPGYKPRVHKKQGRAAAPCNCSSSGNVLSSSNPNPTVVAPRAVKRSYDTAMGTLPPTGVPQIGVPQAMHLNAPQQRTLNQQSGMFRHLVKNS